MHIHLISKWDHLKKQIEVVLDEMVNEPMPQKTTRSDEIYQWKDYSGISKCIKTNGYYEVKCNNESCSVCKFAYQLKCCSQCQSAYYCNEICQKQDWQFHKWVCKPIDKKKLLILRINEKVWVQKAGILFQVMLQRKQEETGIQHWIIELVKLDVPEDVLSLCKERFQLTDDDLVYSIQQDNSIFQLYIQWIAKEDALKKPYFDPSYDVLEDFNDWDNQMVVKLSNFLDTHFYFVNKIHFQQHGSGSMQSVYSDLKKLQNWDLFSCNPKCHFCKKKIQTEKDYYYACQDCKNVWYCSQKCLKLDQKTHFSTCERLDLYPPSNCFEKINEWVLERKLWFLILLVWGDYKHHQMVINMHFFTCVPNRTILPHELLISISKECHYLFSVQTREEFEKTNLSSFQKMNHFKKSTFSFILCYQSAYYFLIDLNSEDLKTISSMSGNLIKQLTHLIQSNPLPFLE